MKVGNQGIDYYSKKAEITKDFCWKGDEEGVIERSKRGRNKIVRKGTTMKNIKIT